MPHRRLATLATHATLVVVTLTSSSLAVASPAARLQAVDERFEEGGLSARENAEAWAEKARAHAELGQQDQAARAYAVALRIQRGLAPPKDGAARRAFDAAQSALPSDDEALDVRVVVVESGGTPGMTVQVEADDMGLVAGAELRVGQEVVSELQVSRSDRRARSPLHPGNVVGLLVVVFVDGYGNELRRVEIEGTARPRDPAVATAGETAGATSGANGEQVIDRTGTPNESADDDDYGLYAPDGELRWLSLGGATALAVGAVGVAAAGMWLAALDAEQVAPPDGAREVAIAGIVVGTGVIALGAALVVTDLLLSPP